MERYISDFTCPCWASVLLHHNKSNCLSSIHDDVVVRCRIPHAAALHAVSSSALVEEETESQGNKHSQAAHAKPNLQGFIRAPLSSCNTKRHKENKKSKGTATVTSS